MKKSKISDKARIQHILGAIRHIETFTKEINNNQQYAKDLKTVFATRNLMGVIGEAANHVSKDLKAKHPDVEWKDMVNMRNFVIHVYFGVSDKVVWNVIADDIPVLKKQMQQILKDLP